MKKINESRYNYGDPVYEQAEISANRFNLIFTGALIILDATVLILSLLQVFTLDLGLMQLVFLVSLVLFLSPVVVWIVCDKLLKRKYSILQYKKFKYIIYVPVYFGLLFVDIMLGYHAVLLIVVPPLMAAQYRFIKRDWYTILITQILTIPIIVYGNFLFGAADLNMIKNALDAEHINDFTSRISLLTSKRIWELFLHYCLPRILIVSATDFLMAFIVGRNRFMLDKQAQLNAEISKNIERENIIQNAVIEELASVIESRDTNTGEHVRRTKLYVELICKCLSKNEKYKDILTDEKILKITSAAPLHDIGKIAVSDNILLKPGKLTPEEFEQIKIHTTKGGEMVKSFFKNFKEYTFEEEAYAIAMHHHEKRNGTGYPSALKGEEIPLEARIMAIADVYDALVSKRVYKDAISPEEAFKVLEQDAGSHFDPNIIEALESIKDEFIAAAK